MPEDNPERLEFRREYGRMLDQRRPPVVLTYALNQSYDFQMQWDYWVDWPKAGRPRIILLQYRCLQRRSTTGEMELVEELTKGIPISEGVLAEITRHASDVLFGYSEVEGDWCEAEKYYIPGANEAAKKRYDLVKYREAAQRRFKNQNA